MDKKLIALFLFFTLAACSLFEGKPEEEKPDAPKPNKTCLHFKDEATKAAIIAQYGKSCKIGDWWGVGDEKCSSSEAKCKSKN
jgi:hypothetical protein